MNLEHISQSFTRMGARLRAGRISRRGWRPAVSLPYRLDVIKENHRSEFVLDTRSMANVAFLD